VKLLRLLDADNLDLTSLRAVGWGGVCPEIRAQVWQLLLGYLPTNKHRRAQTLDNRRQEYASYVRHHCSSAESGARSEADSELVKQIRVDVLRTNPELGLFQRSPQAQASLERVLFIWAVRHPASGYVQGINDLAVPFFLLFLSSSTAHCLDCLRPDDVAADIWGHVEADTFGCLSKLLDGIQDHYVFAQPGIQRCVFKLQELVSRIDESLANHLQSQELQFMQFAFRWINCLLMREIPLPLTFRMWDSYLCEDNNDGFKNLHVYVCAAFLTRFSPQLKQMEFQDLVMYLQKLPTSDWTEKDIETLLAQAYVYKSWFHHSPHHLY